MAYYVFAQATAFVTTPDGGRQRVEGGQHWPVDDPVVLAAPAGLFTSDPFTTLSWSVPRERSEFSEPPVESLTAAPGEKRHTVRRG